MKPAISIHGLSKQYRLGLFGQRRVQALSGLNLQIAEGQIYGLLGPNGAGKSTTIKILLNLIRPSEGRAELFGHAPSSPQARQLLGFLPENPSPYEYLTGRELVELAGRLCGLRGQPLARRTTEVIDQVEMGAASKLQIRRYSKGMVQRIALAQALVAEPKLLVLDEPTSGLDVLGRKLIRDIIIDQRRRGTTVLFCSHIIPDVEALCDRVAVLVGGRLVNEGAVQELLTSQTNTMEATAEGVDDALLEKLGSMIAEVQRAGPRVMLRFDQAHTRAVLEAVLAADGRVTQLSPARFTLEDLFVRAISAAGTRTVGGDIS